MKRWLDKWEVREDVMIVTGLLLFVFFVIVFMHIAKSFGFLNSIYGLIFIMSIAPSLSFLPMIFVFEKWIKPLKYPKNP